MIPKALREQFNLTPGCQLEIEAADALHVQCARKEQVDQVLTYGLRDFGRFDLGGIAVSAP